MATKKKLLQAAAGSAGGESFNVEQLFSTYIYKGNGSSQTIDNDINLGQSLGSGSAEFDGTNYVTASSGYLSSVGTGDFTIEGWWYFKDFTARTYFTRCWSFGTGLSDGLTLNVNTSGDLQLRLDDALQITSSIAINTNTWNHIALCRNSGTTTLYINGSSRGSFSDSNNYSARANNSFYVVAESNGSGGYANAYVSNIRIVNGTAVYTSNFTPSTSELTAISGTSLLTLQGDDPFVDNSSSPLTITKVSDPKASTFGPFDAAEAGEGGLVWIKRRVNTTIGNTVHILFDTERGTNYYLTSNAITASTSLSNTLTSFNFSGFTVGSDGNVNYDTHSNVSWTWRKASRFFDMVTYTGNGGTQTISHNLGTTVGFIIIKRTDAVSNWSCYHRSLSDPRAYIELNKTDAGSSDTSFFPTAPTDTQFTVGSDGSINSNGGTYVAYLFAHNNSDGNFGPDGDADIIKCGGVTTDGSGNATVDLGFEPQWLMIKSASSAVSGWHMLDNMRGVGTGITYANLLANSSAPEVESGSNYFEFTADGFKINAYPSGASTDWIYIAIRRGPMAVPTDATDVFAPYVTSSTSSSSMQSSTTYNVGFPVDLTIQRRKNTSDDWYIGSRLTGSRYMNTNGSAAETSSAGIFWDSPIGAWSWTSGYGTYNWQRRPNYFDVVAYTGTGANRTVSHNLGVAPEMFWVKRRNSTGGSWGVYHKDVGNNKALVLDQSGASFNANWWNSTTPTDSLFYIGGDEATINASGDNYIAYLFTSLDGVSKVGSYTGTGSDLTIDCGFSSGARFVLVKPYTASQNWTVVDTARGLIAGNDPILALNDTGSEDTAFDTFDPSSSGFIVPGNPYTNVSGVSYIFYAIA